MNGAKRSLYIGVFLVGETKCGTSTIADCLFQHPQITPVREDPVARARLLPLVRKEGLGYYCDPKEPRIMLSRIEGVFVDWEQGCVKQAKPKKQWFVDIQLARCLPNSAQTRPNN